MAIVLQKQKKKTTLQQIGQPSISGFYMGLATTSLVLWASTKGSTKFSKSDCWIFIDSPFWHSKR
jgi:hypothetical protein